MRLRSILVAASLAMLSATAAFAQQTYPSRPVMVIVPFAAGGSTSTFARLVADKLSQRLGQQFIVDNRGGAGGNIGADAVAKSKPDGYTLLMGAVSTHAINPSIYARMPFDPTKDFEPIAYVAGVPNLMVVSPKTVKATTVAEFIAEAKATSRRFNMASSGNGTSIHLAGEMFKQATGIEMPHVPYRGSAAVITDLVAGQVDVVFDNLPSSIEQVRAGNLRALAVTSAKRSAAIPDAPTLQESGFPGLEAMGWFAFFAPKGTPGEITAKLNAEINEILQTPEIKERFATFGGETKLMSREELAAFVKSEQARWAAVVKAAGVRIE